MNKHLVINTVLQSLDLIKTFRFSIKITISGLENVMFSYNPHPQN